MTDLFLQATNKVDARFHSIIAGEAQRARKIAAFLPRKLNSVALVEWKILALERLGLSRLKFLPGALRLVGEVVRIKIQETRCKQSSRTKIQITNQSAPDLKFFTFDPSTCSGQDLEICLSLVSCLRP